MNIRWLFRMALLAPMLFVPLAQAGAAPDGWDLLKSLVGEWEGTTSEAPAPAQISYKLLSNGSVVVETLKASDHEMITVYHRDGDALMATHYCAAGNQPRMRGSASPADGKRLEFKFLDATNLKSPDAAHMRNLTMTIQDSDTVTQEWTFSDKGKESIAVFKLKRKR